MKKLILLAGLCLATGLSAQVEQEQKLNIVKTNVPAYAFRNINVSYERVINKMFSVSGGIAVLPKGNLPFVNQFASSNDSNYENAEVSNTAITIEPRIYIGAGYGKGFYFAPYYRHTSSTLDNISVKYQDDKQQKQSMDISGKVNANSAGLMIGAQWFLGEKQNWVLDWWIVGAHYGFAKGNLDGKSSRPLTAKEQENLKNAINDFNAPFVSYKTNVTANGANVELDGPWAGVRAGLAIGYRF